MQLAAKVSSSLGGGSSREGMDKAPVTAATGALGPVIDKLAALLGSEYKLRWRTRRDVNFIRSKLKPVHHLLWNTWEKEDLDAASKALKMEALDLADDMEDATDDFILSMERSPSNKRFIQSKIDARPFKDFKKQASDVSGRCCSKWEKKKPFATGKLTTDSSPGKPRAYPFVRKDASELVGMDGPRDKLVEHLVGKDESTPVQLQLRTACIIGTAGMGKTTLAHLVYDKIEERFQARAFVTLTPGGSMKEVLARILEQVQACSTVPLAGTKASTEEHLIDIISNFLKDKRYLVIIDDIWNWREWEIIMKSLPENNLGSRVVRTTRMNNIAQKWRGDGFGALVHNMLHERDTTEGWVDKSNEEEIANQMIAMKADLVADGFDDKHPIVRMCGGTPLAVLCMLSAVAQEREKQGQQGQHAKSDVQDKIAKHVKENGMQNTPGYEPLVESLQLGYDDLPHHMLKTCLLYCSNPDRHTFNRDDLVPGWVSEGFVYKEEEAYGYFQELVDRGLLLRASIFGEFRMHPMMRNFLRWKSRQDGFTICSSEITSSYSTCRIRRLCIENSPCRDAVDEAADPLSVLDWHHIRSLVVYEGIERVPLEKLERLRVLDLCWMWSVEGHNLRDICGLVRLRHLLGLAGQLISKAPPEIVRLQCLETFQLSVSGCGLPEPSGFIGNMQQLKALELRGRGIDELPRGIGALQQLETLRLRDTSITELPREIGALQQLKTLYMGSRKKNFVLPKEIGKLQHLEHLCLNRSRVRKIPREIGALKELKTLDLRPTTAAIPLEVCQVSALVELPEFINQALKKSGLVAELAGEMLSFQISGGLVVGAIQMRIPPWIKEHFNDLTSLDIRICKLEEEGLKILREMPKLNKLKLRFQVVPKEPAVISSEGFAELTSLTVDSRMPRVTFQEGAMPMLDQITFEFQFYAGPPNKGPVGINHLRSLTRIEFKCNEHGYQGGYSPCIFPMINVVTKEAHQLPYKIYFEVSGWEIRPEKKYSQISEDLESINPDITGPCSIDEIEEETGNQIWPPESPPPPPSPPTLGTGEMGDQKREMEQGSSSKTGETEEEERSCGVGEIEEDIQA